MNFKYIQAQVLRTRQYTKAYELLDKKKQPSEESLLSKEQTKEAEDQLKNL